MAATNRRTSSDSPRFPQRSNTEANRIMFFCNSAFLHESTGANFRTFSLWYPPW